MDAYILSISFIIGTVGFAIALFEVRVLHQFIVEHQGLEEVPLLDENKNYKSKDSDIRKFRRFILRRRNKKNPYFAKMRKKILYLNILSISCFTSFGIGFATFYFS